MGSSLSSHPAYNCINTFQIKDLPFFPLLPPFSSQFFFFAYFTFSFLASFLALFLLFAYDSFSSPLSLQSPYPVPPAPHWTLSLSLSSSLSLQNPQPTHNV